MRFAVPVFLTLAFLPGLVYTSLQLRAESAGAATGEPQVVGAWSAPFEVGMRVVHGNVLPNGKVLLFSYPGSPGSVVRVWDPQTGALANQNVPRPRDFHCSSQTLLADGRLFLSSGEKYGGAAGEATPENDIYDPATGTFTPVTPLVKPRWYPTSVELANGRVLVFGGWPSTVEQYDPVSNTITELPPSANNTGLFEYPRMNLLASGKVAFSNHEFTELFDPAANAWTRVARMNLGTRNEASMTIMLPGSMKLLQIGGAAPGGAPTATAEIIDFSEPAPKWRYTAPMSYRRQYGNAVLLPDGQVLVVGGGDDRYRYKGPIYESEMFNPATETWTRMASQMLPRIFHSIAVLLPDGRVLSAGQDRYSTSYTTAEIYSPPYLFKGPRPTITAAPSAVGYGETFTLSSPAAASIEKVALISPGSVTHGVQFDQRYVPLGFTVRDAASLTVTTPAHGNLAPPGWYMLFVVSNGVPSVAAWVQVVATPPPPDTTAPVVSLIEPVDGSSTTDTTPTFSGVAGVAAGDSTTVMVKVFEGAGTGGALVQTLYATRAAGGSYSVDASPPLTVGQYTAVAEQTDASGNTGTSAASTFTIAAPPPDRTAPVVSLTSPPNGSSTLDTTPRFSGTGGTAAGDSTTVTVKVYEGGGTGGALVQTVSATRATNGPYSADAGSPLALGQYTAQAEQADAAGNTGVSGLTTFTITAPPPDTTAPTVSLTSPANGTSTTDGTPTFAGVAGTAEGDGATVTVKVSSGGTLVQSRTAAVAAGGSYSVDASPALAPGSYTAQAEQPDAAGNTGLSARITFTIVAPPAAGAYASVVFADAPRAFWRLGEASGTTAADELGGATGTYQGGVVLGRTGAIAGDASTAVHFDGSNDRVTMGDPASGALDLGTRDISVELWAKTTLNKEQALISKVGTGPYWLVTVTDDSGHVGGIRAKLFDGAVTRQAYGPAVRVDNGAWHHIVVVYDRDVSITVFVDGTARTTAGAMGGDVSNAAELLLGKASGYIYFTGDLDEAAVYPSALPAARVRAHYDAGRGVSPFSALGALF